MLHTWRHASPLTLPPAPARPAPCSYLSWLKWLYFLSFIKLGISLVKYIPQVRGKAYSARYDPRHVFSAAHRSTQKGSCARALLERGYDVPFFYCLVHAPESWARTKNMAPWHRNHSPEHRCPPTRWCSTTATLGPPCPSLVVWNRGLVINPPPSPPPRWCSTTAASRPWGGTSGTCCWTLRAACCRWCSSCWTRGSPR